MTLRKGQKLSNYIYLKKFKPKDWITPTANWEQEETERHADVDLYLYNMSDKEFDKIMKMSDKEISEMSFK